MEINDMMYYIFQPTNEIEKSNQDKQIWLSQWYGTLANVISGIFTYNNVPKNLKRRIEQSFFNSSYVCAYEDSRVGLIVTPCVPIGEKNSWGEYSTYEAILPNGNRKHLNLEECIIGYTYHIPTLSDSMICLNYAKHLSEVEISIRNSIILSRMCDVIETPNANAANEVLTQFRNYEIGTPIIVTKKREEEKHNVFNLTPPKSIVEYYDCKRDILNDFLTTTGLSSLVNPNKKERLLVDEISSNDDIKNTLLANRIENRIDFIKSINEKFNTNFKVDVDRNIFETVKDLINTEGSDFNVN